MKNTSSKCFVVTQILRYCYLCTQVCLVSTVSIPKKTLGICVCLEMVGEINMYKIQYFCIIKRCTHLPVPSTPKKRIIAVYTKAKMLSCGYQLGLVS